MAAKSLTLNEMVHVTGVMVRPGSGAHAALEASPIFKPMVAALESVHRQALEALPKPEDPRLRVLAARAMEVDAVHDALVSGVYRFLTSLSDLNNGDESYLRLRDELFPEGVAGATQITYEGQAGYARRFRARLTDELRAELAGIAAGKRDLLDVVNEWLDAGDRLGELDQEQERIKAEQKAATPGAIQRARLAWIRTINALRALVPIVGPTNEQYHVIFGPLDDLEARADQRAARRRASRLEESVEAEMAQEHVPSQANGKATEVNLASSA